MHCVFVVLGDAVLDLPEAEARKVLTRFASRIVQEQTRHGLPAWWLRVLEVSGGLHGNFVFPATPEMIASLRSSKAFAPYLRGRDAVQWVDDPEGLADYLTKERGPAIRGGCFCGPRLQGSHRLAGGGDRVALSRQLRAELISAGIVDDWTRTTVRHASTKARKPVRTAVAAARASVRTNPARSPEPPPLAAPAAPEAHLGHMLDPAREPADRIVLSERPQIGATVISR